MIDVSGDLPLTALAGMAGVRARTGTVGDPSSWADAPTPSRIAIRRGAGANGSDRITLIWPDGAIRNTWLQLTIPAQPQLGLDHDLVYYFGNLVGDTGDSDTSFRVNALDLGRVKQQLNRASDIAGRFDFNRDGRVNAIDLGLVKANLNKSLASITAGAPAAASPFLSVAPAANLAGETSVGRVWDDPAAPLL